MRKIIISAMLIGLPYSYMWAQQEFSFKYQLKRNDDYCIKKPRIKNNLILEQVLNQITGAVVNMDTLTIVPGAKFKGTVSINSTKDTLFLRPWYLGVGIVQKTNGTAASTTTDAVHKYFITLRNINTDWGSTCTGRHPMIKLNYYHRQLTATNVPFFVNLNNGKVQANPLNVNLTYLWVWGRTKIYQSEFVSSKNSSWGIGPFVGFSIVDNGDSNDNTNNNNVKNNKIMGLNYGGNIVYTRYKINLIGAFGFETEFETSKDRFTPYIGFGLGLKLIDAYGPGDDK